MEDLHPAGRVRSPLGEIVLVLRDERLVGLRIAPDGPGGVDGPGPPGESLFGTARAQLGAYFRGESAAFDLPLAPDGSAFELRVWAAVRAVPYGRTVSYSEIARRVGRPAAARAVGSAIARNPLMIVTPCHRVVAADGRLCGAGAGREWRRQLLEHEGVSVRNGRVVEARADETPRGRG